MEEYCGLSGERDMIIGNEDGKVILEFDKRNVELTGEEFEDLVYNLEGKLNGRADSILKTNQEIING